MKAAVKKPVIPIIVTLYILGPILEFKTVEDPIIVEDIIRAETNLFIPLFNSLIGVLKFLCSS